MSFWDVTIILFAAALSVSAGVIWLASPRRKRASGAAANPARPSDNISLLFEREQLNHASESALQLYRLSPGEDDWHGWRERMVSRFPALPEHLRDSGDGTQIVEARHVEDTAVLSLMRHGKFTQVQIVEGAIRSESPDRAGSALNRELADLRRASDTTPHAIWQVDLDGNVTWFNAAYEQLYRRLHGAAPRADKSVFAAGQARADGRSTRVCAQARDQQHKDWYDVYSVSAGDVTIYHAMDINAVVKSEAAQRNFVQTLAKTFAQLSIGLAIFDRNGQLALFNPALIDLSGLPADFLSGRPTLLSFFDRLRENRRMPEPKNYNSWRQQIAEVIAAATDGRYQETWTLETGQTYRVHGRPHPDGAIAFLIEDISAEVSLTRNFRAELELGQSLMDSFEEALAVFSPTGVLTFCNLAYRELWQIDPDSSFSDFSVGDSVREWKSRCAPGARWTALADFVLDYGEKETWDMPVQLVNGTPLVCTISRIASGATVVRFGPAAKTQPARRGAARQKRTA